MQTTRRFHFTIYIVIINEDANSNSGLLLYYIYKRKGSVRSGNMGKKMDDHVLQDLDVGKVIYVLRFWWLVEIK